MAQATIGRPATVSQGRSTLTGASTGTNWLPRQVEMLSGRHKRVD